MENRRHAELIQLEEEEQRYLDELASLDIDRLAICLADVLVTGENTKPWGEDYPVRKARVLAYIAENPDDPAVHRAYLAAAIAFHGDLGRRVEQDAAEYPPLRRALDALANDPTLGKTADLGLETEVPPVHGWDVEWDTIKRNPILVLYKDVVGFRYLFEKAPFEFAHDGMGTNDVREAQFKAVCGAIQSIIFLYGEAGLRELLELEEVHSAIRAKVDAANSAGVIAHSL
jgi:hypothetical protein